MSRSQDIVTLRDGTCVRMRRFSSCVFKAMVAAKNRHQNSVAGICRATLTTIALVLSTLVGVIDAQSSNGLVGLPIRSAADVTFALLARSRPSRTIRRSRCAGLLISMGNWLR